MFPKVNVAFVRNLSLTVLHVVGTAPHDVVRMLLHFHSLTNLTLIIGSMPPETDYVGVDMHERSWKNIRNSERWLKARIWNITKHDAGFEDERDALKILGWYPNLLSQVTALITLVITSSKQQFHRNSLIDLMEIKQHDDIKFTVKRIGRSEDLVERSE